MGKQPTKIFGVQHFSYNGFCGELLEGMAPYTARFVKWTNDPGVGMFKCSDGKDRLIPTFVLREPRGHPLPRKINLLPKQDMSKKVMFGAPSSS